MRRVIVEVAMRPFSRVLVAVLLTATTLLPVASYKDVGTGHITTYHGGLFVVAIVGCALAAAALSLLPQTRYRLYAVFVAGATVVLVAAAALTRIKMANDASSDASGPAQTAYALGAWLGIVLAVALFFMVAVAYSDARGAHATS